MRRSSSSRLAALALAAGLVSLFSLACSKSAPPSASDASAPAASTPQSGGAAASTGLAATSAPLAHPCALLDGADVEAALGTKTFKAEEHPAQDPAGDAHCTWSVPGGGGFVEILIHHPSTAERFDHIATLMKRVPVSGIGDKAYADPNLHWGHVDMLKSGQTLMLQVERGNIATGHKATKEQMQEATQAVARKVASKL